MIVFGRQWSVCPCCMKESEPMRHFPTHFETHPLTQPRWFLVELLKLMMMAGIALSLFSLVAGAEAESRRSGVVEVPPPTMEPGPGQETPVSTENINVTLNDRAQNETSIAADSENPLNLVAGTNDYRFGDSDVGVAYSFDGGATWTANTLDGIDPSLGKYSTQGDPAVAAHRNGVFYYAFIDFNRDDDRNRLGVAKSTDGGVTWPQIGVVIDHSGSGSQDFEDKEYIAVDNTGGPFDGNVYVSWTRFPVSGSSRILLSRSTDGGLTFSPPILIGDSPGGVQGSVPVVGPRGEVYVVWKKEGTLLLDKSTDGGVTWGSDALVSFIDPIPSPLPGADFRVNSFPTVVAYRPAGSLQAHVCVAWADQAFGGEGPDILFRRSTDEGRTWGDLVRVSDDTNGSYQWFPWMAVDPDGNIDIIFFDRREDPNSTRYHIYDAQSTDSGLSFLSNSKVTDVVSDAINDGFGGEFIGDYNGVASTSIGVRPFWTDTRSANGNAEGYTDLGDVASTDIAGEAAAGLRLLASPNPFGTRTEIHFELAETGPARVEVLDISGRRVWELARPVWPAGRHVVIWSGRDDTGAVLSSGVYVYRVEAGASRDERKVALIR